ncbi:LacI family DNA-binding transcriptional regulator [Azospirillum thermophilum]|uniref:LacI family transcriptional regulator n=1 Tax=Azospirillum thermophilum TaxID=2202148 RepID=A0A2S2CUL6_9PROT|nr:LacI family DNA-binding transcriptional regulator [Azospirillum thermophilum]AWK88105.1 LacI family transcriptional regulator [Azospirillum thermophilum]
MKTGRKSGGAVSLATIAEAANVSISTVSRIVNGQTHRASAQTAERVRQAIEELGYQPNQIGRALKQGKTRVVAMLTANLNNPVMSTIASATEAALRDIGYVMTLCDTHDREDLQDEYLQAMRAQAVQGYILVTNIRSPGLAEIVARKEPVVFACRRNPYKPGAFVGIDNLQAGAAAADYLWSHGCREPAVVFPANGSAVTEERVAGFCARMSALGVPASRITKAAAPGNFHLEVGYAAARTLPDGAPWPKGMLCVSDQIAYGVYRCARERNLRIPEDCLIVSIDGSELNSWIAPWLKSIQVPYRDFGLPIVEQLQTIWNGGEPGEVILPFSVD